jgi:hypothetical protein
MSHNKLFFPDGLKHRPGRRLADANLPAELDPWVALVARSMSACAGGDGVVTVEFAAAPAALGRVHATNAIAIAGKAAFRYGSTSRQAQ